MFVCDTPFDYSDNIYLVCPTWFINVSSKQALFGLSSAGRTTCIVFQTLLDPLRIN